MRKQLYIMPTSHYVQNQEKLMMESQENDQKLQFRRFLDNFVVQYLQIPFFSENSVLFKMKVIFSTNFRAKPPKKNVRALFQRNIKVSDFGQIWRSFLEYPLIKNSFQKSFSVAFLPL